MSVSIDASPSDHDVCQKWKLELTFDAKSRSVLIARESDAKVEPCLPYRLPKIDPMGVELHGAEIRRPTSRRDADKKAPARALAAGLSRRSLNEGQASAPSVQKKR